MADNNTTSGETEEPVRTLCIARGAKANGGLGSASHGVGRGGFFVDFAISTKLCMTMLGCTETRSAEEFLGAVDGRDVHFGWEVVEPHGEEVEEVDKDHVGKAAEW